MSTGSWHGRWLTPLFPRPPQPAGHSRTSFPRTRPGLDRRIRSCITVAMTVALNRPDELALHLRGARRNGVTIGELREVLLQTAVYCGVPAAHTAFRVAQEVLGSDAD